MYISSLPPPGSARKRDIGPGGGSIVGLGAQQGVGGSGVGVEISDVGVTLSAISGDVDGRGVGVEPGSLRPWQLANNADASANETNDRACRCAPLPLVSGRASRRVRPVV